MRTCLTVLCLALGLAGCVAGDDPSAVEEAASSPTISVDPGCSWYSLKLFDGPGYTGNAICFSGSGFIDLSAYCRLRFCWAGTCSCRSSWAGAVQSYWGGDNFGRWYGGPNQTECPASDSFWLYEAHASVSACVHAAPLLDINLSQL
jgi:hypothetical protein